jgi:polyisoprenoid-binding protein YceI
MFKSLLLLTSFVLAAVTVGVSVDPAASQVTWKGYKVTGSHEGTITVKDGNLEFTDGQLTGGDFAIDMATIKTTDLSGGSAAKLEGHLKSPDFFGVEKFPTATFKITKVVSRGTPGDYRVTGDLTIKESTEEIKFNTKVTEADGLYTATADLTIDRTDFDVRYGSGSFIDNLGDKTIYDEFELGIKLVTKK